MKDSAHDKEHIYRVLYYAMEIAKEEKEVDYDILVCACLLHDIGRKEQFENPKLCHAMEGAKKAYAFLSKSGFAETFAVRVKMCIETHRFREANPPQSIEAKILFDADKLDAAGVMGIARTLLYKGGVGEPLYRLDSDGNVSDGSEDKLPSFLQEYKYKLEKIYDHFYTKRGEELAKERQRAAANFYENLLREMQVAYGEGKKELEERLKR